MINGYPLIYSDTSTYIASGFTFQPPFDRPIAYGIFIRLASLNGLSLWTVLLFQTMLLSLLLYKLSSLLFGNRTNWHLYSYFLVLIIASVSGASWATSYLLPDVFTAIMILSFLMIILGEDHQRNNAWYYILYGFSLSMHSSHLAMGFLLIFLLFLIWFRNRRNNRYRFKIRQLFIFLSISLAGYASMASSISKSKHVFLMGAYIEQGIIGEYLGDHCAHEEYRLCEYKDSLPQQAWEFIWEPSSPLYKLGGWRDTKEEFTKIIRGTYNSPKYLWMHVKSSARQTVLQLIRFTSVDPYGVAPNTEQLRERIAQYIPGDVKRFEKSIQNRTNLHVFAWMNSFQRVLILLSIPLILLFLLKPVPWNSKLVLSTGMVMLYGILINAFICGTFANAIDRMGNKLIWLLPAYATLLLINFLQKTKKPAFKK